MTIYDCFLFLNELDILELRLNELYDVVDYFIIIESAYSFKGDIKHNVCFFQKNIERFNRFKDKIVYIPILKLPFEILNIHHVREHSHWQREMLRHFLLLNFTIKENDIIIVSDLDEIPRKESVLSFNTNDICASFELTMYRFFINLKCTENPWYRAKIVNGECVINNTFKTIRWDDNFSNKCRIIKDAGWHFTSCGKHETIKEKLNSFTHYSEPHIQDTIKGLKDNTWIKNDDSITLCKIDDTYPEDMYKNVSKWSSKGFVYSDN